MKKIIITILLFVPLSAFASNLWSNLWQWYDGNLPPISERALIYEDLAPDTYEGTAEQNEELLSSLEDGLRLGGPGDVRVGATIASAPRGGTGTGTVPTPDQILIGGDTANKYDVKTLLCGSGCSIATSSGQVLITATGEAADWVQEDNFGVVNLTPSTTIPVWFKDAIYASSTFQVVATSTFEGHLTIGTTTPHQPSSINIEIDNPNEHGIKITSHANQAEHIISIENNAGRELLTIGEDGDLEIDHLEDVAGSGAFHIDNDINNFPDVSAIVINQVLTGLQSEEGSIGVSLVANTANSQSGSDFEAYGCFSVGTGSANLDCLAVASGFNAIHQDVGVPQNADFVLLASSTFSTFTDITTAANSASTDVSMFVSDSEYFVIGFASKFGEISFDLDTEASKNIFQTVDTFEHSAAGDTWIGFGANDLTDGMKESGIVRFDVENIEDDWTTATVDGKADKFWIRFQRTRNNLKTVPIENLIQITTVTEFFWDKFADLNFRNATSTGNFSFTGNASSTGTNGWAITDGCFAIDGICMTNLGDSIDLKTEVTDNFTDGSVLFWGTTGVTEDNPNFIFINNNNRFGLGTTTPFAKLSINNIGGEAAFVVGSSTKTNFIIDLNGRVGINESAPLVPLHIVTDASDQAIRIHEEIGTSFFDIRINSGGDLGFFDDSGDQVLQLVEGGSNIGVGAENQVFSLGDPNTRLLFGTAEDELRLEAGSIEFLFADENLSSQDELVVNDGGVDVDFRVESSDISDLFFVEGSTNNVGIATSSPYARLSVVGQVVGEYFTATSTTATSTFAFGVEARSFDFTGATSTGSNGWDIFGGCYAINGVCTALATDLHDAVTLAGVPNYITISGQVITRTKLDINDDTNATGGTGITITTNDFTFDCSEVEGTGINCTGESITLDATGDWT